MLFRRAFKRKIRAGEVTLSFRAWRRPQVKTGGVYNIHPFGAIEVTALTRTRLEEISSQEAARAGFGSLEALAAELARGSGAAGEPTELYRVELRYLGEHAAKQPEGRDAALSHAAYLEIAERLDRMDTRARGGAWTHSFLEAVARRPAVRAADLAASLGCEPSRFKANMRKLKGLGLTESLEVGYRLSTRGASFRAHESVSPAPEPGLER